MGCFHFTNTSKSKKKKGRTTETTGGHLTQRNFYCSAQINPVPPLEHSKPERQKMSQHPDRAQNTELVAAKTAQATDCKGRIHSLGAEGKIHAAERGRRRKQGQAIKKR